MNRISGRFSVALIAIFALSLAPALYARLTVERDECASDAALFVPEALYPGIELITEGPRSTQPEHRRLTGVIAGEDPRDSSMIFTIVRTFGLPNGLLQPAAALPGEREPDEVEAGSVEVDGATIPIHYAYEQLSEAVRMTVYFMTLEGRPITSALGARLRGASEGLASGRWPITLFVASTLSHPSQTERTKLRMDDWVRRAFRHYHAVCPG